jgi:hypothetical protein
MRRVSSEDRGEWGVCVVVMCVERFGCLCAYCRCLAVLCYGLHYGSHEA